jgi:hypothetical protein
MIITALKQTFKGKATNSELLIAFVVFATIAGTAFAIYAYKHPINFPTY